MDFEIYTDGACRGNQFNENLGAWAYIVQLKNPETGEVQEKQSSYATKNTTNNIMELTAVIRALESIYGVATIAEDCLPLGQILNKTTVYSDSMYIVAGATIWYKDWIKRNWKGVKNKKLWQELLNLKKAFKTIEFRHITGHSGNEHNERVDALCNKAMDEYTDEDLPTTNSKGDKI